jgi:DNA excision repair protein ERCC-3
MTEGPLIVQSDKTLLLDVDHPLSQECRHEIAPL